MADFNHMGDNGPKPNGGSYYEMPNSKCHKAENMVTKIGIVTIGRKFKKPKKLLTENKKADSKQKILQICQNGIIL